jgi:hypothetical protein
MFSIRSAILVQINNSFTPERSKSGNIFWFSVHGMMGRSLDSLFVYSIARILPSRSCFEPESATDSGLNHKPFAQLT